MRLKEPLFGIRVAQLYPVMHLALVITQCYVHFFMEDVFPEDPEEPVEVVEEADHRLLTSLDPGNHLMRTVSFATTEDDADTARTEVENYVTLYEHIFNVFMVVHALSFIIMTVRKPIKNQKGLVGICADFVQNFLISMTYIVLVIYCVYASKLSQNFYGDCVNYRKLSWLQVEMAIFFYWMLSTSFFLLY